MENCKILLLPNQAMWRHSTSTSTDNDPKMEQENLCLGLPPLSLINSYRHLFLLWTLSLSFILSSSSSSSSKKLTAAKVRSSLKKMKVTLDLFYIVILTVLCLKHSAIALEEPFDTGSFSVRTTINVVRETKSGIYLESFARIHEHYSGLQERARLSYELIRSAARSDEQPTEGIFYIDKSLGTEALLFEPESRICRESSLDELCSMLNLNLDWWSLAAQSTPRHVVGPSRLLFLVQNYRARLKPLNTTRTFRNIVCQSYTLTLDSMELLVHFSETELAKDASRAVPLMIQLTTSNCNTQLTFASLEPLQPPTLDTTSIDSWPQLVGIGGQNIQLDTFTFPPLTSCINALASSSRGYQLFQELGEGRGPTKLSFDTNFKSQATGAQMVKLKAQTEFQVTGSLAYASQLKLLSFKVKTTYGQRWQLAHVSSGKLYQLIEPGEDKIGGETSCIVTRTRQKLPDESSFGRLLFGADAFVYLGEASIRGKMTQLFATSNGSLPYWLEQPGEYIDHSKTKGTKAEVEQGELKMRPPDMGNARSLLFLDSHTGSPVQLEIVQQFTKHSVEIFNFRWDLDHSKPIGELFSLAQKCHLSSVAHMELVLEAPPGFRLAENILANKRNFALLVALQESLSLEPTTVFDLESKVTGSLDTKQILFATLKIAQQNNRVTDVVYLGQGHANYMGSDTLRVSARTFHICLQLAAQLDKTSIQNLYFGYNALERKCFIDKLNKANHNEDSLPDTITLNQREPMEMYRLNATKDEEVNDRWVEESSRARFKKHLLDLKLDLFGQKFTIHRVEIESGIGRPQFSNLNSIDDVGLVKSSKYVRKVAPEPILKRNMGTLNDYLKYVEGFEKGNKKMEEERSVMTFEQCQAACLSSTQCASFSLCLVNYQLECLLSPFEFKSAQIRQQLSDLVEKRVKLKPNDKDKSQEVELVRHRNCKLYNKNYLDMFGKVTVTKQPIGSMQRFSTVTGREQCAQLCAELNFEVLKQDMKFAKSAAVLFGPNAEENRHLKQLNSIIDGRKANMKRLCRAFHYIGRTQLKDELMVNSNSTQDQVEGYCSLDDPQIGERETSKDTKSNNLVLNEIESHLFRADLFFERRQGVKLLESNLSPEDKRHYRLISQRYDNLQKRIYAPEGHCALTCLLQSLGPWPACRSFDLIEKEHDAFILCQLNSITLHQAVANHRQDLMDQNNSQGCQMWHYEPRPGYFLDELELNAQINLYQPEDNQINRWSIGWYSLLCLMLVAKLGGLVLGYRLGHKLFRDKTNVFNMKLLNSNLNHFKSTSNDQPK